MQPPATTRNNAAHSSQEIRVLVSEIRKEVKAAPKKRRQQGHLSSPSTVEESDTEQGGNRDDTEQYGQGSGGGQPHGLIEHHTAPLVAGRATIRDASCTVGLSGNTGSIETTEPVPGGGNGEPSGLRGQGSVTRGRNGGPVRGMWGAIGSPSSTRNEGRGWSDGPYRWYGPGWRGMRKGSTGGRGVAQNRGERERVDRSNQWEEWGEGTRGIFQGIT